MRGRGRRSRLFHPSMPSIKPVAWVRDGPDGNNGYSITLMLVELQSTNRKRALLLHLAGTAVQNIFATLSDTGTTYADALANTSHVWPTRRKLLIRQVFSRRSHQGPVD